MKKAIQMHEASIIPHFKFELSMLSSTKALGKKQQNVWDSNSFL
jgi:hypothetical protein